MTASDHAIDLALTVAEAAADKLASDIVIIDGSAVNIAPIIDPVGAVVCAADISNVKTVLVDGDILKHDFRLAASLTEPRKKVEASRDYLLSKFGEPQEGWLTASSGREVAATG